MAAALDAVREMVPGISTGGAMALIGGVAESLERDQPYTAMQKAGTVLDVTGTYRLMAVLLAGVPEAVAA
jgi:hypothetical protein